MHLFNHRSISSRNNQDPFLRRLWNDPYLDWALMVLCATLLVIGFVAWGYSDYLYVHERINQPVSVVPTQSSVFDTEKLADVLNAFDGRTVEKNAILKGTGIPGDPSL